MPCAGALPLAMIAHATIATPGYLLPKEWGRGFSLLAVKPRRFMGG
jgi:hypothetical protein